MEGMGFKPFTAVHGIVYKFLILLENRLIPKVKRKKEDKILTALSFYYSRRY